MAEISRHALVCGVDQYGEAGDLPNLRNAVNDAVLVAGELERAGFQVSLLRNPSAADIREAAESLPEAEDIVFYFAGHGVQSAERNWLLCADASIDLATGVVSNGIELGATVDSLGKFKAKNLLVLLDCCRDLQKQVDAKPSALRAGLVLDQYPGMLLCYAAAPGSLAMDGEGKNGPFATALVRGITSNAELSQLLKNVTNDVANHTKAMQVPFVVGSLSSNFFFREYEKEVVSKYREQLEKLDKRNLESVPSAMVLLKEFCLLSDQPTRSLLIADFVLFRSIMFERFNEENIDLLSQLYSGNDTDPRDRMHYNQLFDGAGARLAHGGEGSGKLVGRAWWLEGQLARFIPEDWSDYLFIMNLKNEKNLYEDGGRMMSASEIINRILIIEETRVKHFSSPLREKIEADLFYYLSAFLRHGYMDNSPCLMTGSHPNSSMASGRSDKILPDYVTTIDAYIAKSAPIWQGYAEVRKLREILGRTNFLLTPEVKRYIDSTRFAQDNVIQSSAHDDTFGSGSHTFSLDFIAIGNVDNAADDTGYGSVDYDYRMGVYEVSRGMIDIYNTLNSELAVTLQDITADGGNEADAALSPATGVSLNEAARFVNWLNTSKGYSPAYKFVTGESAAIIGSWMPRDAGYNAANPVRNADAHYFLPSEHEWYKAAYYDPDKIGSKGYWDYATGSDTAPRPVAGGIASDTAVFGKQKEPADITDAGGLSWYGTMAQSGNVGEWIESSLASPNDSDDDLLVSRGLSVKRADDLGSNSAAGGSWIIRGGNWLVDSGLISASERVGASPSLEDSRVGFRVASLSQPKIEQESSEYEREASQNDTQLVEDFSAVALPADDFMLTKGKCYTIAREGEIGVSLSMAPDGHRVADVYHGPDTLLVALPDDPVTVQGAQMVRVKVGGWMAARNLQNGDVNIVGTQGGGGIVTWDGGGNPNNNFISVRTLGIQVGRIAKVYQNSQISFYDVTTSDTYELVQAEVSGWIDVSELKPVDINTANMIRKHIMKKKR